MELMDLYQDLILDHNRAPRNFRALAHPDRFARGNNPLCGDKLELYLDIEDDRIADATFQGSGCAISTASASLMTEAVKGKTVDEAHAIFRRFHGMITGNSDAADDEAAVELGKLEAFSNVGAYPARAKCATLAWHTLEAALAGKSDPVTTE